MGCIETCIMQDWAAALTSQPGAPEFSPILAGTYLCLRWASGSAIRRKPGPAPPSSVLRCQSHQPFLCRREPGQTPAWPTPIHWRQVFRASQENTKAGAGACPWPAEPVSLSVLRCGFWPPVSTPTSPMPCSPLSQSSCLLPGFGMSPWKGLEERDRSEESGEGLGSGIWSPLGWGGGLTAMPTDASTSTSRGVWGVLLSQGLPSLWGL